jgi:hypothetical protein
MSFLNSAGLFDAIPDSALMRLTFDDADTSGSTAEDVWNDNDGTINGATTGASGANQTYTTNEAYSFDSSDYVDLPDLGLSSNTSFTLVAWANLNTLASSKGSNHGVFGMRDGDDNLQFDADKDGDKWQAFLGEFNGTRVELSGSNNSAGSTNTWYHVALTYNSNNTTSKLYVDASSVDSNTTQPSNFATTESLNVGRRSDGASGFDGEIDDPRIYSKALSGTEVSNLYNNGSING